MIVLSHRYRLASVLAAAALLAGCARGTTPGTMSGTDVGVARTLERGGVYWGDRRPATFPAEWPHKAGRAGTFGAQAMIASDAPLATEAGLEVLRAGGNAVDAAVAVGFALAVVYPEAGNLGGGGYMVIRMADGRTAAIDYREKAPAAASRDMYVGPDGKLTDASLVGPLASGVPGAVAGMLAAHARFGKLKLHEVIGPAHRYADQGFVVDSALSRSLRYAAPLIKRFAGANVFYPNGEPLAPGTTFRQPALAATLRRIVALGHDGFYRGATARMIADEMKRLGGIITEQDLASYQAASREPVRATYRGHTLLSMPPSSSGGTTMAQTLNILEGLPVSPFGSATYVHHMAAAYQRAFLDRNTHLGDPDVVQIPTGKLLSKEYAAQLRAGIAPNRATPTSELSPAPAVSVNEPTETTHYSVVDAAGNAVSTTTTINALYGSGVYVAEAGFFLNDEMDDFAARPGEPNMFGLVQGEANAIAPNKRMLSAMTPTIVLSPNDSVLLVVGARGGPRIITSTSQIILNVIDHRMTLADAMSAPRLHHQSLPDTIRMEPTGFAPAVLDSVARMGYGTSPGGVGLANGIMRVPNGWHGVSDPRGSGHAQGY